MVEAAVPFEDLEHAAPMLEIHAPAGALAAFDPQAAAAIAGEEGRLRPSMGLIASENYASNAVREAVGSVLTNKYAEGYPGKRYYAGNRYVDEVETLAIERAQALFRADHANAPPHAGAQAHHADDAGLPQAGELPMRTALDARGPATPACHLHARLTSV